jgi:hypothetical protein
MKLYTQDNEEHKVYAADNFWRIEELSEFAQRLVAGKGNIASLLSRGSEVGHGGDGAEKFLYGENYKTGRLQG